MRCKAGRTGGPADEDFELSRFYHFKQGAGDDSGVGDEEEDEKECRMGNIQPVLAVDLFLSPFAFLAKQCSHDFRPTQRSTDLGIDIEPRCTCEGGLSVRVMARVLVKCPSERGQPRWEQSDSC